jgi:effector-binding domain-containing protein
MKRGWMVLFVLVLTVALAFAQTEEKKVEAAPPAVCKVVGEIAVQTVPAVVAVTVMEKAATYAPKEGYKKGMEGSNEAYMLMMTKGFEKLTAWIQTGGKPVGPPFAIYYDDPAKAEALNLTCKIGFPVMGKDSVYSDIKLETLPEMTAAVVKYQGPYEGSDKVWQDLDKWITSNGYQFAGPPWEVYLRGQNETKKPAEYLTEIRVPVTKAVKPEPKKEDGEKK